MSSALLAYDAVDFNKYLDTVLAASSPPPGSTRSNQSPWLFLDAAHTLFETAKRRVYAGKLNDPSKANSSTDVPDSLHPVLEELPKWRMLAEVLEEIERDFYFNPVPLDDSSGAILVMCGDNSTARQLREYLQTMRVRPDEQEGEKDEENEPSAAFMMRRKLRNYIGWKRDFSKVSASLFAENNKVINNETRGGQTGPGRAPPNKRRRVRGGGAAGSGPSKTVIGEMQQSFGREAHMQSLLAELQPMGEETQQKAEIAADPLENMEDYYDLYEMKDLLVIHPYDGDMDEHVLEEVRPRYVIMYEPDAAFIRRIEVYRSSHTDRNVRVYFMYYGGSVEEQRYLSTVRREKDSFSKLIRERSNMAIVLDNKNISDPQEAFLRTVNTRIAGGGRVAATATPPRVVVDVREFRSSLPSLLHGRNMVVVPCMLTVGDYVLTPNICIERKSVRDLISSFNNGRLYNQAETMLQHYKNPMLLIEFDQNKSFTLEPFADLGQSAAAAAMTAPDLQAKIVMLTIAFPRLRIIWSSSPYQTAEILEELKKQQEEPDPIKAVQIGLDDGEDAESKMFNQVPQDMLRAVPGVSGNENMLQRITVHVENVFELANMTEEELNELCGREVGRQIHRFFNRDVVDD